MVYVTLIDKKDWPHNQNEFESDWGLYKTNSRFMFI